MNEYTSLLLTVIQYSIFALLLTIAITFLYKGLFDEYSRRLLRKKFISHYEMQKQKAAHLSKISDVTDKFIKAQIPFMTNIRFAFLRIVLLFFVLIGFGLKSGLLTSVVVVVLTIFATEPTLRYSLTNIYLNSRIKKIEDEKESELFNLFALFKTDIMSDRNPQVNVYYLVNRNIRYFNRIQPTLVQFLQVWTKSPEAAGEIFAKELSGESAEFLGDFMGKLDSMNRTDALHLLSEQSDIFSHNRSEHILQKSELQRNGFYLFFFISAFTVIGWFMWFMYDMTARSLDF